MLVAAIVFGAIGVFVEKARRKRQDATAAKAIPPSERVSRRPLRGSSGDDRIEGGP